MKLNVAWLSDHVFLVAALLWAVLIAVAFSGVTIAGLLKELLR